MVAEMPLDNRAVDKFATLAVIPDFLLPSLSAAKRLNISSPLIIL
jgi:hypothetical protein